MTKLFHIYDRKDLSAYDHCPVLTRPVYGVYHVYCDTGWEGVVTDQVATLRSSGLLAATQRLYVSMITFRADDEERLRRILPEPQVEIIAVSNDPKAYEYPALRQVRVLGMKGEAYIYYFHTKGISYQTFESRDRRFLRFRAKIVAWREMLEYFIFTAGMWLSMPLPTDTIAMAVINGLRALIQCSRATSFGSGRNMRLHYLPLPRRPLAATVSIRRYGSIRSRIQRSRLSRPSPTFTMCAYRGLSTRCRILLSPTD